MQHFTGVKKLGPSLGKKIKHLGATGNIPPFCAYQDASSVWHVTQHCPTGMTFPDLNAMVLMNQEVDKRVNQDAFRDHNKKQKGLVRKWGPSILAKTLRLGQVGDLGALSLYQDPSTGSWRLSVHCPAGMKFPDLNELIELRKATKIGLPIRARL